MVIRLPSPQPRLQLEDAVRISRALRQTVGQRRRLERAAAVPGALRVERPRAPPHHRVPARVEEGGAAKVRIKFAGQRKASYLNFGNDAGRKKTRGRSEGRG